MEKIPPKLNTKLDKMLNENSNCKFVSSKYLRKKFVKSFNRIRHYYKSIVSYNRLEPQDRWIYENYYTIERAYKETYHALKNEYFLASNKQKLPDLLIYLMEAVSYENFQLNENTLVELINIFEKKRYLHNFEYDFFNIFIKVSVVMLISEEIKLCLKESCIQRICNLIGILASVDLIDFASINYSNNKLEAVLLNDPIGVYSKLDDKTKSIYRYKVAKAAFYENSDEVSLAKLLMKKAATENNHIGFYIYKYYEKVRPKNPIAKYHIKLCFFLAAIFSFLATAILRNIFNTTNNLSINV